MVSVPSGVMFEQARSARDLNAFLSEEVYPRLSPEQIYNHPVHAFQVAHDKLRGRCPFHESKSGTSFVVTPSSLLWYCPACGVGGTPIQYLASIKAGRYCSPRGPDFIEVARELARRADVEFPERELSPEQQELARKQEAKRAILKTVEIFGQKILASEQGRAARDYLIKRGFNAAGWEDLGFGLIPTVSAVQQVLKQAGHDLRDAKEFGLFDPKLTNCITIPWADQYGRPQTMYFRYAGDALPAEQPKTLALKGEGSKKSPLYFDRARKAGCTQVTLVEGVLDAALLQNHGFSDVIACVGAQLSNGQTTTLAKHNTSSVTICLDPDGAGANGTDSCIRQLNAAGISSFVAPTLPDGMDPDEFLIRHGDEAWKALLKKAVPSHLYHAQRLLAGTNQMSLQPDRRRAAEKIRNYIARLSDHLDREDVLNFASEELGYPKSSLIPPDHGDAWEGESDPGTRYTANHTAGANGHAPAGEQSQSRIEVITAEKLMTLDIPDPKFIVADIVPEGLSLLVSKPKLGKSWMALLIAIAVAAGGVALGSIDCTSGAVLYLALEDNRRRLRKRLAKLLTESPAPKNLAIATQWPRLGDGGSEEIGQWLDAHPDARLVIVDTLAKIRPLRKSPPGYAEDYDDIAVLKSIADKRGIAVLVIHHDRKMSGEDPVEQVSGTMGLTGAADAILMLRRARNQPEATLIITGRDVEERELALKWDPAYCLWSVLGDAQVVYRSNERKAILEALRAEGRAMSAKDIAQTLGEKENNIKQLMYKMKIEGTIRNEGTGKYVAVE